MSYDRMIVYKYSGTGLVTDPATGSASTYSEHAIKGRLYKVAVNTGASGTITLTESGVGETLLQVAVASGTGFSTYYPRTTINTTAGVAVTYESGNMWESAAVNNYLRVQHTAGSPYQFNDVRIYYR